MADEIRAMGRESLALTVDVTQEQSVADMVRQALEKFPRLDILLNDFSTRIRKPMVDFPVEEWQQVMDFNIRGTVNMASLPVMQPTAQAKGPLIHLPKPLPASGPSTMCS
ncbi:MAG: SDR family NAD(P)-dependent oxidoreductase [Deltaproteobacteria bacterium]|nr:SDR family NAD(P)-dependent oxidoreductase [Deltaproteobacteria bacterium]